MIYEGGTHLIFLSDSTSATVGGVSQVPIQHMSQLGVGVVGTLHRVNLELAKRPESKFVCQNPTQPCGLYNIIDNCGTDNFTDQWSNKKYIYTHQQTHRMHSSIHTLTYADIHNIGVLSKPAN